MKLVNCILFAAIATSASFANASEAKAACTSEPSVTAMQDRSSLKLVTPVKVPAGTTENGSRTGASN